MPAAAIRVTQRDRLDRAGRTQSRSVMAGLARWPAEARGRGPWGAQLRAQASISGGEVCAAPIARMRRTLLQRDADTRARALRSALATDLRRMREDTGITQAALAHVAGLAPSTVSMIETGRRTPTLEVYARVAAALGADLSARIFPNTGPAVRDRLSVPMTELLLSACGPRWQAAAEVAVRRPARGWIDQVLWEPVAALLVATEIESMLRRVEQQLRWSGEKAASLPSSDQWTGWTRAGEPQISRLLVVRWTRTNRDVAIAARRQLAEVYPADPRDALDALAGMSAWPGAALVWARLDTTPHRLEPWRP